MFIQTEATPNPATLKFIPGKPVLADGTADFRSRGEASKSPLAQRGCSTSTACQGRVPRLGLHLGHQGRHRVAASEADGAWRHHGALHVGRAERRQRQCATTKTAGNYDAEDEDTVETIKELLETRVRPAVAQDGGDITFSGFRDGVVYLHMRGACAGCPSSTATLRHGIENLLKHFCPDVQGVQAV